MLNSVNTDNLEINDVCIESENNVKVVGNYEITLPK